MAARQWTEEDLQALREAAEILERLGVWSVYVRGDGITQTTVHVSNRNLAEIARLPGTTVAQPQWRHGSWEVRAEAGGLSITARVATEELPAVGWRLASEEPRLERVQEVGA